MGLGTQDVSSSGVVDGQFAELQQTEDQLHQHALPRLGYKHRQSVGDIFNMLLSFFWMCRSFRTVALFEQRSDLALVVVQLPGQLLQPLQSGQRQRVAGRH